MIRGRAHFPFVPPTVYVFRHGSDPYPLPLAAKLALHPPEHRRQRRVRPSPVGRIVRRKKCTFTLARQLFIRIVVFVKIALQDRAFPVNRIS